MYDSIVIGQGPAGVTCAIYLKRYNLNPLVIGKDFGALETKTVIDNYYGIAHIDGKELIQKGINQAKDLGIEFYNDEVISLDIFDGLKVICKNKTFETKSIFIATGKERTKLILPNLKNFEGKGISYCATCDGFFYKKKRIGIVGDGAYMLSELEVLKKFSDDVFVFTNGKDLEVDNTKTYKEKIKDVYGSDTLQGVELIDGTKVDLDGLFIAVGSAGALSFGKHLGLELDDKSNIVVKNYMTNIDGIFAGGDAIGGLLQVSKATGDGAQAALMIKNYLQKK
jgi:thioredoxin reductase (NADPH)